MFTERWSQREQDIAQEWIQRDSEKRRLGRLFGCCPFSCYRRMTIMCYYSTFCTCGVLTLGVLVVLAILIFHPFKPPMALRESNCTTYDKIFDDQMSCSCGSSCSSEYPCIKIYVWFLTEDEENVTTMLQDSHLSSHLSESCTYKPHCHKDKKQNKQRVEEYDRQYGIIGLNFSCLYDTNDIVRVIRNDDTDEPLQVHVLIWPGALIALSALGFFLIYHVCGCKYVCHIDPPEDVKAEAAANPLVATELTPAGIVITEVPSSQGADGASQVPLVGSA